MTGAQHPRMASRTACLGPLLVWGHTKAQTPTQYLCALVPALPSARISGYPHPPGICSPGTRIPLAPTLPRHPHPPGTHISWYLHAPGSRIPLKSQPQVTYIPWHPRPLLLASPRYPHPSVLTSPWQPQQPSPPPPVFEAPGTHISWYSQPPASFPPAPYPYFGAPLSTTLSTVLPGTLTPP